jgi:hypothetical protein
MGELSDLRDQLDNDGIVVRRTSDIEPEAVEWVWPGRIPRAALTVLAGHPGLGKSTLAIDIAARVSRGQYERGPAAVIIASAEDAPAHTIVPRLMVAGADLDRVHTIGMRHNGIEGGLVLPEDIAELEAAIIKTGAELVIIDPIVAHLSGSIDSHRDHSVRTALAPVAHLATNTRTAVFGLMHLNKAIGGDALSRISGSVGFAATARSVLLFANPTGDESDPERILAHPKNNLGPTAVALRYRIEERVVEGLVDNDGKPVRTGAVVSLGEAPGVAAAELLHPDDPTERPQRDLAAETILGELTEGDKTWKAIATTLGREGISEHTGRKARDELKHAGQIDRTKDGLHGGWTWGLVEDANELAVTKDDGNTEPANGKYELANDIGDHKSDGQVQPVSNPEQYVIAEYGMST